MGVGKDTVRRWIKQGLIRPHTNAINPQLTDANKTLRMKYAWSQLHVDREAKKIKFKSMHNVIHIDEKWFYITQSSNRYYMLPNEIEAYRTCQSKKFITKVMFICAVGRPLYSSDGTCLFDGKIGIFPFTEQVAAQRNSKNRVKGTMVTKNIESITKNVIKDRIITQVIPALKSKWPVNASKDIYIQQDNAKPHIHDSDQDFRAVACADGFNIKLICQPPNSPDTNINDLGWFRSIQSLQQRKKSKNVEDLVQNVKLSFEELTNVTLNKIFLSLQATCVENQNRESSSKISNIQIGIGKRDNYRFFSPPSTGNSISGMNESDSDSSHEKSGIFWNEVATHSSVKGNQLKRA